MKQLLLIFLLFLATNSDAQEGQIVTLSVVGQGKSIDEARTNALRSAIEQAFGAFISSNSKIINDSLVQDEIISISNGNIESFEVLGEDKISDGDYISSLRVKVSISNLAKFSESHGTKVEFGGELFAYKIKLKKFNYEQELKAIKDLRLMLSQISKKIFDYEISTKEPVSVNGSANAMWNIRSQINITPNPNLVTYINLLKNTLTSIALKENDIGEYKNQGITTFPVDFVGDMDDNKLLFKFINRDNNNIQNQLLHNLYFRNPLSIISIFEIILDLKRSVFNFEVNNGISTINGSEILEYYNCMYSGLRNYEDGTGTCKGRFGLTERNSNIEIINDRKILSLTSPARNSGNVIKPGEPIRLISDLHIGDLQYFLDYAYRREGALFDQLSGGMAIYLNDFNIQSVLQIVMIEKRAEEEIMKIKQYQIKPQTESYK